MAEEQQYYTLKVIDNTVQIDNLITNIYTIHFKKEIAKLLKTINIEILFRIIIFYIVFINTLFLFCLQNINKIGVKLDNL